MRKVLVHCQETGGLLPEDPFPQRGQTVMAMVARGWLRKEGDAYVLTEEGRAVYPWRKEAP